ncbi:MAG: response regulator, partial [Candidatus Bathyarchaeota archaeon]
MFVSDEWVLLNNARSFLEVRESDFHVDIAVSAEEALLKHLEDEYDVVVSDYEMSSMNGLELLLEVRKRDSEIPFIIYTSKDLEEVTVEAFRCGATGCIRWDRDPTSQYTVLADSIRDAITLRSDVKKPVVWPTP